MLSHEKSMQIKLGVKFEGGKLEVDPFQDEDDEKTHPDWKSYRTAELKRKTKQNNKLLL